MNFILRIFFSGLIAFVPGKDGKTLTVLLLDSGHAHEAGQASIPEHKPVLIARAGKCAGSCTTVNDSVAQFLYADAPSPRGASNALAKAAMGGSVWELAGADLSFGIPARGLTFARVAAAKGKDVPSTAEERADFGWVPSLKAIDPSVGDIDPAVLAEHPPEGLIVARLQLTSGRVSTYSMVQVKGDVTPIDFRPMASASDHPYARAAASWVSVDIEVPGDSVEIVEDNFKTGVQRKMSLTPDKAQHLVELAVLNISQPKRPVVRDATPQPGAHFSRYWDLLQDPPAAADRAIPQLSQTAHEARPYAALHPKSQESALLTALLLFDRGPYDQLLCPMSQVP